MHALQPELGNSEAAKNSVFLNNLNIVSRYAGLIAAERNFWECQQLAETSGPAAHGDFVIQLASSRLSSN